MTSKKAESITSPRDETINTGPGFEYQGLKDLKTQGPRLLRTVLYCNSYSRDTMRLQVQVHGYVSLSCTSVTLHWATLSLVPRLLTDFILQPWRKIGREPGSITCHRSEWWTWFHNNGNVPRHRLRCLNEPNF